MPKRSDILEFAILGVLAEGPQHGYELRKRLTAILGPFRPLSFGSLYPALHRLQERGLIEATGAAAEPATRSRRSRVSYAVTTAGADAFSAWANEPGPDAWDDEGFATRMAFFARTEARVRLRILEGRRSRLEERVAALREAIARSRERVEAYSLRMQEHNLEGAEREVRWVDELITHERSAIPQSNANQKEQS